MREDDRGGGQSGRTRVKRSMPLYSRGIEAKSEASPTSGSRVFEFLFQKTVFVLNLYTLHSYNPVNIPFSSYL